MPQVTIDDATFTALRKQAAEAGLTVEEWLQRQANGDVRPEATIAERLRRLKEFEATLVGRGGKADFRREDVYD